MAAVVAMVKEEGDSGGWARPCDSCRSAASAVYCRADSAYLCPGCDARVHAANWVASRHERVWVCEACERAPASLTCKADAASLCAACDARIHAANPLASRHCRLPISPISAAGRLFGASPLLGHRPRPLGGGAAAAAAEEEDEGEVEEDEVSSWLLLNPAKSGSQNSTGSNGFLFGGDVDEYLDLVEYNSAGENQDKYGLEGHGKQDAGDGVVPGQSFEGTFDHQLLQQQGFQLEMEYAGGLHHSSTQVSLSSLDMTDAAVGGGEAHWRPPKGTTDLFASPGIQTAAAAAATVSAMDREARVHRYREKRKHRRFEKTIRYASRKAYAETRPRIKGRFAKRTSAELDAAAEHMFRGGAMAENSYGVVPSLI